MTFSQKMDQYIKQIDDAMRIYLHGEASILEAMRYSAMSGGKRLRPVLMLAFCEATRGQIEHVLPFACALEMIHTYSLIHDDLPCMDNDDLRRGKPTNHKVFGESMAVLAGDALLTQAFAVAATGGSGTQDALRAIQILSHAAGVSGMIGGQVLDMTATRESTTADTLTKLQRKKTGALILAAADIGCLYGNPIEQRAAQIYAENLGLAFQIQDDILDIEGDVSIFGKPIGSDEKQNKVTFPAMFGLTWCKEKVKKLTEDAICVLEVFPEPIFLRELAQSLLTRQK